MIPVSRDYIGSPCELKDVDNQPLLTGNISNITNDYIEIHFNDEIVILPPNTLLKVTIHNEKLGLKVVVGKVYVGNANFLRIIEVISLADFEKRDFFRITIGEKTTLYREQLTPLELHYTKQQPVSIYMNNISLCGLYFTASDVFCISEAVYIVLSLAKGADIFPCIIRRTCPETNNGSTRIYGYGCEFLNHSQRQSDALYKYIFDKQLAYLKRNQNLDK